MAKKGKDDAPTANGVANRDIIQRLNFLYQASVYLNTLPSSQRSTASSSSTNASPNTKFNTPKDVKTARKRRNKSLRNVTTASELSRSYIATMKSVGQKTTVKIDPGVKRTLCKGCNLTLIPGATATVRVKKSPSHGHIMVYTCTGCNTSRRIPAPPTLREDRQKRKTIPARIPPLFARDAGHVVFCGNERLLGGEGVYIT
ncbi:Ribonuclease P protein subunit rpr2 [Termitomyces sp. J132]|nr:Ribonuclease P protein subunit rpr2 [Termitomyces sp. J132]